MLKNKTSFLFALWVGIHFFIVQSLQGQILNWSFENIHTDVQQSGARSDVAVDESGNFHVVYWQVEANQLIYALRSATTGQWTTEKIPDLGTYGYASAITVKNNIVHVGYIANQQERAYLKYAKKEAGSWTIEALMDSVDIGVYGQDLTFPNHIQHSLDIILQADGNPALLFFNGKVDQLAGCGPPALNDKGYISYELNMNVIYKDANGDWPLFTFPDVPYEGSYNCIFSGDRFGEFCKIVAGSGGRYFAVANSMHNHEILLYESAPNDLTSWTRTVVDSMERLFPNDQTGFRETFEYIDIANPNGSNIHLTYSISNHYGFASETGSHKYFLYTQLNPDSLGDSSYTPLNQAFSPNATRNRMGIASPSDDSIFISFYNNELGIVFLNYSFNGGLAWQQDTLYSISTNSTLKTIVVGDSVFVLGHDATDDFLICSSRATSGGAWKHQMATISETSGEYLHSAINRNGADDEIHLAYNESVSDQLLYRSRINGNWTTEEITPKGEEIGDIAIQINGAGFPCIAYVNRETESLYYTCKTSSGWTSYLIEGGKMPRDVSLSFEADSIHVMYFDLSDGVLRHLSVSNPANIWKKRTIDDSSPIVGQNPNLKIDPAGGLHLSYLDAFNSRVKYGYRAPGGTWSLEYITDPTLIDPGITIPSSVVMVLDSANLPFIALRNGGDNSLFFVEKDATSAWVYSKILGDQSSIIGAPLKLIVDDKDRPWVLYNFSAELEELRLMRRDANKNWNQVSVTNNNAQIANVFDFHLIEEDFYIIGKKNQLNNKGIGLIYAAQGVKTDLETELEEIQFTLAPNPTKNTVRVSFQNPRTQLVQIELYNLGGQKVHTLFDNALLSQGKHEIDGNLDGFSPGIYLCKWSSPSATLTSKLVIIP